MLVHTPSTRVHGQPVRSGGNDVGEPMGCPALHPSKFNDADLDADYIVVEIAWHTFREN